MYWYLEVLKKYATFEGRARRKEYWFFTLVSTAISLALGYVEGFLGLFTGTELSVLSLIYLVFVFLPTLAVAVRRLHDIGRSGWWYLLNLVPLVGSIVVLIFLVQDSQPEDNQYGANPKRAHSSTTPIS